MSVETSRLEDLGRELGRAIMDLPEYRTYEDAKRAVEESTDAQAKIDEFDRLRQEFLLARQTGQASQEDLNELQRTQQELHGIPVMAEYLDAQRELDERLAAVNDVISEPLAIDFGEQAGGCCHD